MNSIDFWSSLVLKLLCGQMALVHEWIIIRISIRDSQVLVQQCRLAGGRILVRHDVNTTGLRDLMKVENYCCTRSDMVISWLANNQRSASRRSVLSSTAAKLT